MCTYMVVVPLTFDWQLLVVGRPASLVTRTNTTAAAARACIPPAANLHLPLLKTFVLIGLKYK